MPDTPTAAALTPERVAAMSDEELSEFVATYVFGAEYFRYWPDDYAERKPFWCHLGSKYPNLWLEGDEDSLPVTPQNGTAVDLVLEHMRQRWARLANDVDEDRVCYWVLESNYGGWDVRVEDVNGGTVVECLRPTMETMTSLGRAVFECALLASVEYILYGESE